MVRRCINVHGRLCKLIQLANLHTPYLEAQMAKHILTFAHLPLKHMNLNKLIWMNHGLQHMLLCSCI